MNSKENIVDRCLYMMIIVLVSLILLPLMILLFITIMDKKYLIDSTCVTVVSIVAYSILVFFVLFMIYALLKEIIINHRKEQNKIEEKEIIDNLIEEPNGKITNEILEELKNISNKLDSKNQNRDK